ncbi:hypothetical protein BDW22DRAFT_789809 [Trametopsis cervina]|nr:hypothetical protein BDW22DRAFT_789809 [Trametopsis cervina]
MYSFKTLLSLLALATAAAAVPSLPAARDADPSDWKYAVGWDGTILPSEAIGTPANATHLQKRTVGGVYICVDINWGGRCGYAVQPLNTCIVLGSDWNKQISSFGPDPCTRCFASSYSNCGANISPTTGDSWTFNYPGDPSGGAGAQSPYTPWNDKISSFSCSQTCAPAGPANP